MRIEVDRLEEFGGRFSEVCSAEELPLDDRDARLVKPAEVRGEVERNGREIEFRGQVSTEIEVPCNRCLKTVALPINTAFHARFVPAVSWGSSPEHELGEDDLKLSVFEGDAIELRDLAREEILLAIPGHVLCCEDCKGLCPVCGGDLNAVDCKCAEQQVDSRWAALKDLRNLFGE
jgi:uncharacterized protein